MRVGADEKATRKLKRWASGKSHQRMLLSLSNIILEGVEWNVAEKLESDDALRKTHKRALLTVHPDRAHTNTASLLLKESSSREFLHKGSARISWATRFEWPELVRAYGVLVAVARVQGFIGDGRSSSRSTLLILTVFWSQPQWARKVHALVPLDQQKYTRMPFWMLPVGRFDYCKVKSIA